MSAALRSRYELLSRIGTGKYGKVFKARDLQTGQFVAIKKIRLDEDDDGVPHWAIREISFLKSTEHENVVRLLDVVTDDRKQRLYLAFELMECDLYDYLNRECKPPQPHMYLLPLPIERTKKFMYQLLLGVSHCHSNRIVHRDLKPQNILLDRSGCLKIADFGLARAYSLPTPRFSQQMMTLWYRAPEVLLEDMYYSMPVDIWSLGCILAELASGHPLFPGDCEMDQLKRIFRTLGTPDESVWPGVSRYALLQKVRLERHAPVPLSTLAPTLDADGLDLLGRMLAYSPERRITADEALQHPFFARGPGAVVIAPHPHTPPPSRANAAPAAATPMSTGSVRSGGKRGGSPEADDARSGKRTATTPAS